MDSKFWHRKRVLVTGGCGFVGRWLCRVLAPAEVELHILDLAQPANFEIPYAFHKADLRDPAATQELVERTRPEVIIHLAGQPGVGSSHDDPRGAFEANVLATFNVLEACRRAQSLQSMVAVSSNHVYGDQHAQPTPEDAPLNGAGTYAVTKLCSDVLARTYGKTYGLPIGIARMTNSYGGDDHHVTHIITGTILAVLKGEQPVIKQSGRDLKGYLYIKDTAEGLLAVAQGVALDAKIKGEAFNLVPDQAVTVIDLVRTIADVIGKPLEPIVRNPDGEFEREHLDNGKAHRLLSWSPKYSLRQGLAETIAWYRSQGNVRQA